MEAFPGTSLESGLSRPKAHGAVVRLPCGCLAHPPITRGVRDQVYELYDRYGAAPEPRGRPGPGRGRTRGSKVSENPSLEESTTRAGPEMTSSHGWRWLDRSAWTVDQEAEYIRKTVDGESCSIIRAAYCEMTALLGRRSSVLRVACCELRIHAAGSDSAGHGTTTSRMVLRDGTIQSRCPIASTGGQDVQGAGFALEVLQRRLQ
jgi:hypothetical protein